MRTKKYILWCKIGIVTYIIFPYYCSVRYEKSSILLRNYTDMKYYVKKKHVKNVQ